MGKHKKINKCTVVGTIVTVGTGATGTGLTWYFAETAKENCINAATSLFTGNFTVPPINTVVKVLGMEVPIGFPSQIIPITTALGESTIELMKTTIGDVCKNEIIRHGVAYTTIAFGIVGLLTYVYNQNANLKNEIRNNNISELPLITEDSPSPKKRASNSN